MREHYAARLTERREAGLHRRLIPTEHPTPRLARRNGRTLLNFAGNDYLALSQHPTLKRRAVETAEKYGVGTPASRSVCGHTSLQHDLEQKAAEFFGVPHLLILASGYQTCSGVLAALLDPRAFPDAAAPAAYLDKAAHASLYAGTAQAGAERMRFRHNDLKHLESLLRRTAPRPGLVIAEGLYSMDGDGLDVRRLVDIARSYGVLSLIDDAHGVGMLGPEGRGSAYRTPPDVLIGTFSKAFGGFGGFVGCDAGLHDYLVNACGGLIYSTALPPAVLGAIDAALDLMPTLEPARKKVRRYAGKIREAAAKAGRSCGRSDAHIVPVLLPDPVSAAALHERLCEEYGVLTGMIRPPSVPSSRLRICPNAAHSEDDIDLLCKALEACT